MYQSLRLVQAMTQEILMQLTSDIKKYVKRWAGLTLWMCWGYVRVCQSSHFNTSLMLPSHLPTCWCPSLQSPFFIMTIKILLCSSAENDWFLTNPTDNPRPSSSTQSTVPSKMDKGARPHPESYLPVSLPHDHAAFQNKNLIPSSSSHS